MTIESPKSLQSEGGAADVLPRLGVVIVAGGGGRRMGGALPKQFQLLDGLPVLARTVNNFAEAFPAAELVVVLPESYLDFWQNLIARFKVAAHKTAVGGIERFYSVCNGLAALESNSEFIAVQDGVRPLGSRDMIRRTLAAAMAHDAAVPAIEPVDSFRQIDDCGSHIVDRSSLRRVQTPQIFRADLLLTAYAAPYSADFTDDASVVERSGVGVFLCEGERSNLKITTPEDLVFARALLEDRKEKEEGGESL